MNFFLEVGVAFRVAVGLEVGGSFIVAFRVAVGFGFSLAVGVMFEWLEWRDHKCGVWNYFLIVAVGVAVGVAVMVGLAF